jgi:hypothetical protein
MPLDVSRAPTSASPLWIIALFIALSEATAGIAAIITNGPTRLIFACFAVTFPSVVFAVFVWLLVRHAPNLYAPGQYSRDITPEVYRTGISRTESIFLGRAVAKSVVPLLGGDSETPVREADIEQVARRFEEAIAESSVSISLEDMKRGAGQVHIPVDDGTSIQSLLDQIFFELDSTVQPGTYGRAWVLVDEKGEQLSEMGMSWARKRLGQERDPRTIAAVGILPGAHLTATRLSRRRTSQ